MTLMNENPKKPEQPKQLIVEGNDEVRVFSALCRHLDISDLQIQPCGGYQNLRRFLMTLRVMEGFDNIQSLAVVADANANRSGRRQSIENTLSNVGLPVPSAPLQIASQGGIQVAYLVVPHDSEGTMLEDVCLASVSADSAMKCVDEYFECLDREGASTPREVHLSKARVHAFLASRDSPDLRIGEAADGGVWQFDDDAFRPMRELLTML